MRVFNKRKFAKNVLILSIAMVVLMLAEYEARRYFAFGVEAFVWPVGIACLFFYEKERAKSARMKESTKGCRLISR